MRKRAVVAVVFGLMAQTGVWWLWWQHNRLISEENHVMEMVQAALILLAMIGFTVAAAREGKGTVHRCFWGGLALLCATFVILEVDTRGMDAPVFNSLFHGTVRDLWLAGLWILAAGLILRQARAAWHLLWSWLRTEGGLAMASAGGLWLASAVCDKSGLFTDDHHFVEELIEVSASILMLLSAVLAVQPRRPTAPADS